MVHGTDECLPLGQQMYIVLLTSIVQNMHRLPVMPTRVERRAAVFCKENREHTPWERHRGVPTTTDHKTHSVLHTTYQSDRRLGIYPGRGYARVPVLHVDAFRWEMTRLLVLHDWVLSPARTTSALRLTFSPPRHLTLHVPTLSHIIGSTLSLMQIFDTPPLPLCQL